jgi:hypothetical protein
MYRLFIYKKVTLTVHQLLDHQLLRIFNYWAGKWNKYTLT